MKSFFIVVDGPSASGKDSIIRQLTTDLKKINTDVITLEETKDPTYDREKILAAKTQGDKAVSEAIIHEREKLYQSKVVPHLAEKVIIIANRGEPSTLAYQTVKQEISMEDVWRLHRANNVVLPDLFVITNCSAEESLRREKARGESPEEKDKKFLSGKFTIANEDGLEKRRKIHEQYEKVKEFLETKGVAVIYLYTDHMNVPEESEKILESLNKLQ